MSSSPGVAAARYRISRRLGQGGMAEVFEAEVAGELGFVRKVAIKRMLADAAADPAAARRFLDEARIASRLHHANIVAVTDVGLLDGLPFQVLELVDGVNAQQLQQRAGGVLPLDVSLIICAEVAHALDHAHRATDDHGVALGFVHRDVKPSNVLVSRAGDVKLADFGIALARDRSARTETGIVAGTLGFIAPEQRTRSEVDGRADVFALGLTLHAFLTGYTPLRDISAEVALLEGTPVPLDAMLPADVRAVIARAVAPSRLERPTAGELAAAFGALLAPELARSGSDARTRLRAFLESLDTAAERRPRAGALDQLLGIEIVPASAEGVAVPEFKTVAAKSASSNAPTVHLAPTPPLPRPPPSRRAGLYVAVAFVIVAAGGIGVWQLAGSSSSPVAAIDAAGGGVDATAVADELETVSVAVTVDGAAAAVDAGAAGVELDVAMPPDARVASVNGVTADAIGVASPPVDAGRHIGRTPKRPAIATPASPDTPPAAVETGWIQVVGGEELVGARVLVDGGRWKFSVPNKHEVTVGSHRVEVIKPDGTKLPAKTIEVTTFHTMRKAARVTY